MRRLRKKLKERFRPPIIGGENAQISRNVKINTLLTLEDHVMIKEGTHIGGEPVSIGRYTGIMNDVEIIGPVSIGRFCAIARKSLFQGRNHYANWPALQTRFYKTLVDTKLPYVKKEGIEIGHAVWIGTRAIILAGVKIGHGAIIGAGSVVTKDVLPFSITVGNPAVHKKYRFPEKIIKQLLEIEWWNWSYDKIRKNKTFFTTDLTTNQDLQTLIIE
ncbi:MAG: CatB-related O-acetyltransferase [Candidatus Heimdallarchaeota archaeon]